MFVDTVFIESSIAILAFSIFFKSFFIFLHTPNHNPRLFYSICTVFTPSENNLLLIRKAENRYLYQVTLP